MTKYRNADSQERKIFVALPAMNERDFLPQTIEDIVQQSFSNFQVFVCVNQPESFHHIPEKQPVCQNNAETLHYLKSLNYPWLHIIDRSSIGNAWPGNTGHVGTARRCIMDAINHLAAPQDIILSLDADTRLEKEYFESVLEVFENHPKAVALSNPYYHPLSGDENVDRAMLRYEIYMRHYALNLKRIGCPYNFTALGSAIAVTTKAYRAIGGITAKKSGEDFYFLQKLRKYGEVEIHNRIRVYPAARFSDRVFFGTGPALIKGANGNWDSYPIYDFRLFDHIRETYLTFPLQFHQTHSTPISHFLKELFGEVDIFEPLRKNSKTLENFIRACHHKIDGLRILQYLKATQSLNSHKDEDNLREYCFQFLNHSLPDELREVLNDLDFSSTPIEKLNQIRDFLTQQEYK